MFRLERLHRSLLIVLASLVLAGHAPALVASPPMQDAEAKQDRSDDADDKPAEAQALFKEAVALHKAIRGLRGTARREAQEKAAQAFVAVADRCPGAPKLGGRALFRAAQLYEHMKDRELGVRCLTRLFKLETAPLTQARGHNLLGHMYRRAKNLADAAKEYEIVMTRYPKHDSVAADTLAWYGKCKARLGDQSAARKIWRDRIERFPSRDRLVIETHDWIACSFYREGQKERAAAELDACRKHFADVDQGGDAKRAARVRKRLERMRILRLMAKDAAEPKPAN